jgi:hypothetical protein
MSDRRLLNAYLAAEGRKVRSRAGSPPSSLGASAERYRWSARDIARELGVSERTARRYRQQDRVPARKAAEYDQARTRAESARTDAAVRASRSRIASRGLRSLTVGGRYRVSSGEYETPPNKPVRVMDGNYIPGAGDGDLDPGMADVFDLLEAGDLDGADTALQQALSNAYGTGGTLLDWSRVDSLGFTGR